MTRQVMQNSGFWPSVRRDLFRAAAWVWRRGEQLRDTADLVSEAACRRALQLDPDNFRALTWLARQLMRERRDAEAIELWRKAISLNPEALGPAYQLGRALQRSGDLFPAAQQYLQVLTADPAKDRAIAALEQVGVRLARTLPSRGGNPEAAARIAKQLQLLQPRSAKLAQAARAIGEAVARTARAAMQRAPETALSLFHLVLVSDDRLPDAIIGAAECLERLDMLRQAATMWDRLAQLQPTAIEPSLQRDRLLVLQLQKEAMAAGRQYGHLGDLSSPEQATILARARLLLFRRGEADNAFELLSAEERAVVFARASALLGGATTEDDDYDTVARLRIGTTATDDDYDTVARLRSGTATDDDDDTVARLRIGTATDDDDDIAALLRRSSATDEADKALANGRASDLPVDEAAQFIPSISDLLSPEERQKLIERARMRLASTEGDHRAALLFAEQIAPPDDDPADSLEDARRAYEERRFDVAQTILYRILARDRLDPAALALQAGIQLKLRKWREAKTTLMTLATVSPSRAHSVVDEELVEAGNSPTLLLLMAEVDFASGETQHAARAVRVLASFPDLLPNVALSAARLGHKLSLSDDARTLYQQAYVTLPSENLAIEIARFCSSVQLIDEAISSWTPLIEVERTTIEAIGQICRLMLSQSRHSDVVNFVQSHADRALSSIGSRPVAQQSAIMLTVNRYIMSATTLGNKGHLQWLADFLEKANPAGPIAHCLRARLFDSLGQKSLADEQVLLALEVENAEPAIDIVVQAEACVHAVRYGLFGEANRRHEKIKIEVSHSSSPYSNNFRTLTAVNAKYAEQQVEFYPECLLQEILAEGAATPIGYEPKPDKTMMVVGSLAQGGGEKQTVTVARSLIGRGAAANLYLAVRTIDRRPADDFFVPVIESIGLDWSAYGGNWDKPSFVADHLPELEARTGLAKAIDLLPHNFREELVRLSRLILDVRPQAVHIWQDMPVVALACLLCGVPKYFIHRGSLSADYWQFNDYQWHTHFRPMQYLYRFFVERPGFFFVNNSKIGCETDANWIDTVRDDRFRVVYNAVQFESLGENSGPNLEMRKQWGIPEGAPVIGGSFRIVPVKRPRLWMETARLILDKVPDAHFVIIGGGDMTEEVEEYARQHGFADRFHLPGRVADVGAWYRVMDVMLHTSEREGIPNAIIECQHFGVPVVATDVGGIPEAIDVGTTGYLIKDATAENYAAWTVEVLSDEAWRLEARERAPKFVHERFSLDTVLAQFEQFYGWA